MPLSLLPVEILAEIFIRCLPGDQLFVDPHPLHAPLLLCGVCRQWRLVALNTPQLWQSLLIVPRCLELCGLWISRAGNCPLSLRLDISDSKANAAADSLLRTIADLAPQWRNVDLGKHVDLPSQHGTFPLLEKLAITPDDNSSFSCSFLDAPNLRHVYVDYIHASSPRLQLPWSQLTTFIADFIDLDRCVQVLRCTPLLVECTLVLSGLGSAASGSMASITVPPLAHLHTLNISLASSATPQAIYTALLGALTLPALHALALCFPRNQFFDEADALLQFVERSGSGCTPMLRVLALAGSIPADLLACLRRAPRLRALAVELRPDEDRVAFFRALTLPTGRRVSKRIESNSSEEEDEEEAPLLPHLATLRITLTSVIEPVSIGGAILAMLDSRWGRSESPLRVFELLHEQTPAARDEARSLTARSEYGRLVREGMRVWVGVPVGE